MNYKLHAIGSLSILYRGKFKSGIRWKIKKRAFRARERIQKLKDYVATPEVYRTAKVQDLYRRLRVKFDSLSV